MNQCLLKRFIASNEQLVFFVGVDAVALFIELLDVVFGQELSLVSDALVEGLLAAVLLVATDDVLSYL